MKYLRYLVWAFILFLSFFFYGAYLANHTYYYNMLQTASNWYILIFWVIAALIPTVYILLKWKKTWKWLAISFLVWFALFSLVIWINKWWFLSLWYIIELFNYATIFVVFSIILLWMLAIWDFVLQKISFKEKVYDFSIKIWLWLWLLWIFLFYVTTLHFLNIPVSVIIFLSLIWIIFYRWKSLKEIFSWLLESLEWFVKKINDSKYNWFLYAFWVILILSFFYIFVWLNYTFIPYPTAWDANHAYMFIPKVLAEYGGYPWNIDFRPTLGLWSAFLAWIYNLWSFTAFSQDTWMIVFNFFGWIFSLFFWFMLITTIVKIIHKEENAKHYLLLILWYWLILTWLTSWMGAFLVFVDNKTDLAVLMFVILWLFLALYGLFRKQEDLQEINDIKTLSKLENKEINTKEIEAKESWINKTFYIFLLLAGFFFGIANFIKPTATFDFFQTTLVLTTLEIWFITVIWIILFVAGLLALLKFRWFDKAVPYSLSLWFLWTWFTLSVIEPIIKLFKDKAKVFWILIFIWWFIWTLLFTKWFFWIVEEINDHNLNLNPTKLVSWLIMWESLPTLPKKELTWSLYSWLKKDLGSSYHEDNGRYAGYGKKNFWNPWWSFIVPSNFKKTYCIYFNQKLFNKSTCSNKEYALSTKDVRIENILNNKTVQIYSNKNNDIFEKTILNIINQNKKWWKLKDLAKQLWINSTDLPDWSLENKVKKQLVKNTETQLIKKIKSLLANWKLNISDYPKIFDTSKNVEILRNLKDKVIIYHQVKIPYKYIIPFNVTFNWSLQNLSSYYTDIGITWLILAILTFFALIYSIWIMIVWFIKKDKKQFKDGEILFAFSFATLVGWTIWYFVASGIVWYDIGGIVWLIITTIFYTNRLKDRNLLIYVLLWVISIWIFLNLMRIASQWGWQVQTWYRSSIWETVNYTLANGWIVPKKELIIPYKSSNVFNLQFNAYKKPIKAIDDRTKNQTAIIWWTYMRYFVKDQNRIQNDQFLQKLWRWWSDDNINKFYKRLKDQWITDIVLDPNIASVVQWKWNEWLWYRYYGKTDANWNITEEWVFPHFVDLAQSWLLEYGYTNNLWIKYALVVSNKVLSKVTWITNPKELRKIRYEMSAVRFLPRLVWQKEYFQWINAIFWILVYRATKQPLAFAWDLADVLGLNINNIWQLLNWGWKNFDKLSSDEKVFFLQFNNIMWELKKSWWNKQQIQKILWRLLQSSIWSRAQLMFVKIK